MRSSPSRSGVPGATTLSAAMSSAAAAGRHRARLPVAGSTGRRAASGRTALAEVVGAGQAHRLVERAHPEDLDAAAASSGASPGRSRARNPRRAASASRRAVWLHLAQLAAQADLAARHEVGGTAMPVARRGEGQGDARSAPGSTTRHAARRHGVHVVLGERRAARAARARRAPGPAGRRRGPGPSGAAPGAVTARPAPAPRPAAAGGPRARAPRPSRARRAGGRRGTARAGRARRPARPRPSRTGRARRWSRSGA